MYVNGKYISTYDLRKPVVEIVGKVPVSIDQTADEIVMRFSDGTAAKFYHEQDCCEDVTIDEVAGDWSSLIGSPILVAEERTDADRRAKDEDGYTAESWTWTFYTFRGNGGSVDVRWYGSSNGYYSESVDMILMDAETATRLISA